MKRALVVVLLAGCAASPVASIQWIKATPEQVEQWCGKKTNGCYKVFGGVCTVIAPDPPLRADGSYYAGQWAILGHEVKHCFDGEFHR